MVDKNPKIGLGAARRMAAAALDVIGDRQEDLPRYALSSLFDEETTVAVYEAMTAARREWDGRASSRIRSKRSGA